MVPTVEVRLRQRVSKYLEIQSITGQPAISIGVLHHGQTVWTQHLGSKDAATAAAPDNDTLYCIASLTKQMFAASLSCLIADGKISWDTRIASIAPDFAVKADEIIGSRANIRDILSHRTGLLSIDQLVQGIHNEVSIGKSDVLRFANALPCKKEFRTGWTYNNMMYSAAGHIIEVVSGSKWEQYMKKRILEPNGMHRTTASRTLYENDDNVAKPYVMLTNGTPHEMPAPPLWGDSINGSAGGRSILHS